MRLLAVYLLVVSMLFSDSLWAENPSLEQAIEIKTWVVKVNDKIITEKDVAAETEKRLAARVRRMPPDMKIKINDGMRNVIRTSVVEMLVEKTLIEQKLAAEKITITDEQVMAEIEQFAKQQNLTMEDVPAEIAKFGRTMDDLKSSIKMNAQWEKLFELEMKDKDITEADMRKFYDENLPLRDFDLSKVKVRHILIIGPDATETGMAAAKERIVKIHQHAKSGAEFAELVKLHSACPSALRGGELNEFGRGQIIEEFGQAVPEFEQAAFALQIGEISPIVETKLGYHIINKSAHTGSKSSFWPYYREKLRNSAKIEYFDEKPKEE